MSMPAALDRYYTREEVLAFPDDGNRYELVHGELLVSPAPRSVHQRVVLNLARRLQDVVRAHGLGEVFISPADVSFAGRDVLVQPDVFVVGPEHRGVQDWSAIRRLALVAEVLSPSTSRADRFTKRRLYQEMQVPVYWIIDPDLGNADVWTPDAITPRVETERLTWQPAGDAAPLVIELRDLFEE